MSFWSYRPYVPVANRRAQAAKEVEKLKKKGRVIIPVVLEGRKIAQSFWGKAWCDNLERYSDFENRLPRGRTYVRNGSVVDLQITRGRVQALVSGSEIYEVKIDIALAAPERWKAICRDCAGSIGSLVELLKGKLSKNVMERVCRENDGLFPAPREIKMSCTCPDWADMCKHVAATLYGAGARLDQAPELLFALRGVDSAELIAAAGAESSLGETGAPSERILADDDVAALFGIEMEPTPSVQAPSTKRAEGQAKRKESGPSAQSAGGGGEGPPRIKKSGKKATTARDDAPEPKNLREPGKRRRSTPAKAIKAKRTPATNAREKELQPGVGKQSSTTASASQSRKGKEASGRTRAKGSAQVREKRGDERKRLSQKGAVLSKAREPLQTDPQIWRSE
jgi:uncharacterized Zn finger protein